MSHLNNTDDNLECLSSSFIGQNSMNASARSRSVGPISSPDSRNRSTSNDWTVTFCDLARTVNVNLPHEIARNVLTLIRLGVPPDDIYVFLRECLTYSRFNIHQQQ